MTVSGTKTFELDVTEYIEEAFERCGLEARTGYDLKTAKRSLNLMLAEWANRGLNQWTIARTTVTLTQGTRDYNLGLDTIDVLSAVVRRSSTDYALDRVSRDADLNIPNKSTQGGRRSFLSIAASTLFSSSGRRRRTARTSSFWTGWCGWTMRRRRPIRCRCRFGFTLHWPLGWPITSRSSARRSGRSF
jgi:hypothetical protein